MQLKNIINICYNSLHFIIINNRFTHNYLISNKLQNPFFTILLYFYYYLRSNSLLFFKTNFIANK